MIFRNCASSVKIIDKQLFMNRPFILLSAFLILLMAFGSSSCQKRKLNRDTTTATDQGAAQSMFNDVFKVVDEVSRVDDDENKSLPGHGKAVYSFGNCATISVTPAWPDSTFPKTYTIDFGETGCTGVDLRVRRGKVIAVLTDRYSEPGCVASIALDDYAVDNYEIEGWKRITNQGRNLNGHVQFLVVADGKVTSPEGHEVKWKSTRTNEWWEGESTLLDPWDDIYAISGSAEGTNRDGRTFTISISSPLIKRMSCRWLTEGVISLEPDDLKTRTVDFGNGTCDNKASVTIGNDEYTITLR